MSLVHSDIGWISVASDLGNSFRERAVGYDDCDEFVFQNYQELKAAKVMSLHVPEELGGGGASYEETCDFLRVLAQSCGSTALSLSMHTHLVAALVWRWENQRAPVDTFLRRIVDEQIVLVSSGGSDWLEGSASAEPTDGGFIVSGKKIFASGCPVGDLLLTTAVLQTPDGPQILHFPVNLHSPGVTMVETWRTMGMRGTGSNDVVLDSVFVPEAAVSVRRPRGKWHASMHLVAMVALPLIYSVYCGLAERASDLAVNLARRRAENDDTQIMVGQMKTELLATQIAWRSMVSTSVQSDPGPETTDVMAMSRTLVGRGAIRTAELAMEAAGGATFFRKNDLERAVRDIQAARYHPLQLLPQSRYTGRTALGLPID